MGEYTTITSDKSKKKAILLACLGFVGLGGIHDFYLGRYGMGILKLFTLNFCMFGTILDLINLASGSYRDNIGAPIRK